MAAPRDVFVNAPLGKALTVRRATIIYIAPLTVMILSIVVSYMSRKVKIPLLLLGLSSLIATYSVTNLENKLYINENETALLNNNSFILPFDQKAKDKQEKHYKKTISSIEIWYFFLLITSLGVILISNLGLNTTKQKIIVRAISFIIIALFLMPFYGDKHLGYYDTLHHHHIWQVVSSYWHIH